MLKRVGRAVFREALWGLASGAVLGCVTVLFESLFVIRGSLLLAWGRLDAPDFLAGVLTLLAVYAAWGGLLGALVGAASGVTGRACRGAATGILIWVAILLGFRDLLVLWTGEGPGALAMGRLGAVALGGGGLALVLWIGRPAVKRLGRWLPGRAPVVVAAIAPLVLFVILSRWDQARCGEGGGSVREPAVGPNILLVSLDTVRADALGCYGNLRVQTPRLDALAAEGARFARATIPMPITRPSHATMLTGLNPLHHGVVDNVVSVLSAGVRTLAEALQDEGYRTGAFVSSEVLVAPSGLDQGFDVYNDCFAAGHGWLRRIPVSPARMTALRPTLKWTGGPSTSSVRPGEDTVALALSWLSVESPQPFFAFLHLYDAHAPYLPAHPEPFRESGDPPLETAALSPELAPFWYRMYEAEVSELDGLVGRVFDHLDAIGVREETVVVVTSDHGESFADGYYYNHGERVFESVLRVPLVVRYPGVVEPGVVLDRPVEGADLVPTLLDWAGASVGAMDGESLAEALAGAGVEEEAAPRTIYATSSFRESMGWRPAYATLRRGDHKWVLDVVEENTHWEALMDSLETPDVSPDEAGFELEAFMVRALEGTSGGERMVVDEATRERMRALGYLD